MHSQSRTFRGWVGGVTAKARAFGGWAGRRIKVVHAPRTPVWIILSTNTLSWIGVTQSSVTMEIDNPSFALAVNDYPAYTVTIETEGTT